MKTPYLGLIMVLYCICCKLPSGLAQEPTEGVRVIDEDDQGGRCEEVNFFTRCVSVGYQMSYYPNFRGHETIAEAAMELGDFYRLVDSGCSEFILQFLCSYYLPFCFTSLSDSSVSRLRPCRSLCEAARYNCSEVLSANSNFTWPTFLDCSLDTFSCETGFCFGPTDLPIPPSCADPTTSDSEVDSTVDSTTLTTDTPIVTGASSAGQVAVSITVLIFTVMLNLLC